MANAKANTLTYALGLLLTLVAHPAARAAPSMWMTMSDPQWDEKTLAPREVNDECTYISPAPPVPQDSQLPSEPRYHPI